MAITDYGVKGLLHKALSAQPKSLGLTSLARRVPSNLPAGTAEKLDFLGTVPAMREWLQARTGIRPAEYKYHPILKKFETTLDLPLDWINNDKTGNVQAAMTELVSRYNPAWPAKLLATLLNDAATGTAFDGVAFLSDSRTLGKSGTIDNNLTYNASAVPTVTEAADAIVTAYSAMMGFLDDQGEPVNEDITDLAVVCAGGSTSAAALTQACSQARIGASGVDNPVLGMGVSIRCIATPRITIGSDLGWFLVNVSPNACPFVFIENTADFAITMKGAGSDYAHDSDAWQLGIKAVGCAAYGRPTDVVYTLFN
jgi:phage major head subunit gpT-like protein